MNIVNAQTHDNDVHYKIPNMQGTDSIPIKNVRLQQKPEADQLFSNLAKMREKRSSFQIKERMVGTLFKTRSKCVRITKLYKEN